ncbi:GNAT family N-acetyltransferase [Streptomyces sp. NPDC051172]|uniref:GNAT family N-acetyltransferase n=1 Tax=Streptomyces sp. NPDC051172 TaxID=3155796 RepID=UPI00342A89EE
MRPDDWYLTDDLDTFLTRAGGFLRSRPALHTVPLTVTEGLRTHGSRYYGAEAPYFGVLASEGAVRAVYFRTPPYRLSVTSLTPEEADSLAAHLAGLGRPVPGVTGERSTVEALARSWEGRTGATATVQQRQRLYRLDTLTAPQSVPEGRARIADAADREQLVRWYGEFMEAIGESRAQPAEGWADSRISYGGTTFWEAADGTPVAMAGVTPMVAGQVRVAPVYTPAPLRGRGYAGAVTAEVSRAALAAGAAEVLLFTDLANPTSNALYQRIGYRPVAEFAVYDFTATA